MRDYIIVMNKESNEVCVLNKNEYGDSDNGSAQYSFIDDSDSAYKASIKAKEIRAVGVEKFLSTRKATA